METRKTLIERVQNTQDDKNWEEFVHFYSDYIYKIICSMGLPHHDIEDLRQQILLKTWNALPSMTYDPQKNPFRSWLSTIVKNTVRSFYKKASTKMKGKEQSITDSFADYSTMPDVDAISEKEWKVHVSSLAMEAVSKKFDEKVITVYKLFAKGKSGEEVAKESGVSINSIFVYKKRVQNALIKEILRLDLELS